MFKMHVTDNEHKLVFKTEKMYTTIKIMNTEWLREHNNGVAIIRQLQRILCIIKLHQQLFMQKHIKTFMQVLHKLISLEVLLGHNNTMFCKIWEIL